MLMEEKEHYLIVGKLPDNSNWSEIGTEETYTLSVEEEGKYIQAVISYQDGQGFSNESIASITESTSWIQQGNDIEIDISGDHYSWLPSLGGNSIIISDDGSHVFAESGGGRVYGWDSEKNDWNIVSNSFQDLGFGTPEGISFSADGSIVALGFPTDNTNGENSGKTSIFKFINGEWSQLGNDIYGESYWNSLSNKYVGFSGTSLDLSADGNYLAIGAPSETTWTKLNNLEGVVRIYEYKNGDWSQIGNNIYGETFQDYYGEVFNLSADGSRVAIGAGGNDGDTIETEVELEIIEGV